MIIHYRYSGSLPEKHFTEDISEQRGANNSYTRDQIMELNRDEPHEHDYEDERQERQVLTTDSYEYEVQKPYLGLSAEQVVTVVDKATRDHGEDTPEVIHLEIELG